MSASQQIIEDKLLKKITDHLNKPENSMKIEEPYYRRALEGIGGGIENIYYDEVKYKAQPQLIQDSEKPHLISGIEGIVDVRANLVISYSGMATNRKNFFSAIVTANINPDTGELDNLLIR